ncbi:LOW QUALITY PROTEIN: protein FAM205A-2-like [Peromyscus californicus insignis]|uniref:LOW QUALITY PROTEIN: protein FAM205A-2-like n=1 Tax=Peromyscus californicus insignis TaxID=564181 RepID=UPI0022A732A2|nr:LOW QUALITY PROTEIN: protein FAM205A-2-like [Peromyscus californicus insignis]
MLSSSYFLWDTEYSLYAYFYIFIIILIIWQVQQNYHRLKCEHTRSCCRRHRKVRQRARDAASRARRLSREEAEKPWELLTIMKSQSWLPKEEHVRQLLCVDPCCHICDAASLEIQQLLQSERTQTSPALSGLPPGSSCLEMLPISRVSFEQNMELHPRHSRRLPLASGTPILAHLTEHLTQSTSAVGFRQCYADLLQVGEEFHRTDMPMVSETVASSGLREPVVLMTAGGTMHNNLNYIQQNQDHQSFNSQISFQTLNPESTRAMHPMTLSLVTTVSQPFLSPDVLRLLELHVKKLVHFQRWGLPRRVEESLRQLIPNPPMYFQPENNQPVSFILNTTSRNYVDRFGNISHQTWCSCTDSQPTQTFWVSEWSNVDLEQKTHCEEIPSPVGKPLFTPDHSVLRGICLLPEGQAKDSRNNLQKKCTQLFCGLPSMHSESLVTSFLGTQDLSKDTPQSSYKDPDLLKESPPFPLLPHTLPKVAPPSSSTSNEPLYEHQDAQLSVPFLTLAECKTLEWHLLQRQLQIRWGLPGVTPRSPYVQSHIQYKPCNKTKPHETLKASCPGKSFSVLTRDLFFIPDHTRRLLEFHLQKHLIHLRWGLPQRIQRSIHSLLSSTDQQSRSRSSRALPNVSIPPPGHPEADGSGDMFALAMDRLSVPMPHFFVQAKAMLKSHVDSKCDQIHQGKVPACVQSSWECRTPRILAVGTPFSKISPGQPLELQAENDSDLHHKVVPLEPGTFDQEKQASSGTLIEHCRRPQALPEETIKKLETTLRHKYLAFLSGLPALYCVTPSRAASPAIVSHSATTEMPPGPVKIPQEQPLTQMIPLEDLCRSGLEPCTRDDKAASVNTTGKVQPEGQVKRRTEKVSLDSQREILGKLNFHLKKKVLEIKLGIPVTADDLKELNAAGPESKSMQEPVRSLGIPEGTELQKLPGSGDSPPAPDTNKVHLKKQPATAGQPVCHKPSQPSSRTVPHGSAQWGSKASKLRNKMESQVYCIQMETSGDEPSLEKPFSTEPQGKSKSSAHVTTLTEKSEEPGKPKAVGDLGERDADLGLSPTREKTHHDGDQEPEKGPLHRTPQGSSQQRQSFHLEDPCLPSPQEAPDLEFPEPPPKVFVEREPEHDMQDSQAKVNVSPKPAKVAKVPQPVASQASRGLPFPHPPTQGKPFGGQTWQDHISRGQVIPTSPHASPSLPEAGLKTKMKSFFHAINPKIKGKTHVEPIVSTPGKAAKTSKENVDKGLPQAKSPTKKIKTENVRGPKAQSVSSEKSVITCFLTAPHISDSKLRPGLRQLRSVSAPGRPRHCPRHCPLLAYAIQYRNPP